MGKPDKIESTDEAWESGELGTNEDYVSVADDIDQDAIDESIELQMISIRLQKSLIEDLKMIADYNSLGYQPLIKQILRRFTEAEKRMIMKDLIKEKKLQQEMEAQQLKVS